MMQKKSIKLFIVFVVLFVTIGMSIGIYSLIYTVSNHLEVMGIPARSKIAIGLGSLLLFDPLLLRVYHHAKLEQVKPIRVVAACLFVFISLCVILKIISLL